MLLFCPAPWDSASFVARRHVKETGVKHTTVTVTVKYEAAAHRR